MSQSYTRTPFIKLEYEVSFFLLEFEHELELELELVFNLIFLVHHQEHTLGPFPPGEKVHRVSLPYFPSCISFYSISEMMSFFRVRVS